MLYNFAVLTDKHDEIVRISHIVPTTAKILEARKTKPIKYSSDLEKILGPHLTRKVLQYVEVKDKSLTQFTNTQRC